MPTNQVPASMQVLIGGLPGFATLSNPSETSILRATERVSLYSHVQAIVGNEGSPAALQNTQQIAAVFANTGAGQAELNISDDPTIYLRNVLNGVFMLAGLYPTTANVNLTDFTSGGETAFDTYVDVGRATTSVQNYAPIFSPNASGLNIGSFGDPQWDAIRADAIYGGGLSLDTPPAYFLGAPQAAAYEAFTVDEIKWALGEGLRVTMILSSSQNDPNFLANTQAMVATLIEKGALPTQWVVEDYDPVDTAASLNAIGSETASNSVTGVALWLAQNAPVSVFTYDASGKLTGSVASTLGGQAIAAVSTAGVLSKAYSQPGISLGSGPDSLVINVSEDAWCGDAQFTISVNGQQIGGVQTVTAQRVYGQSQNFVLNGDFSSARAVGITFLNDLYAGAPTLDRNLYVNSATLDGASVAGSTLNLLSDGAATLVAQNLSSPTVIGVGPDTLAIGIAGDYALGQDPAFSISVDGSQIGGTYVATASNALGQIQTFDVLGVFGGDGPHTVSIDFLNDAYAPGPGNDRNLYVTGATVNGQAVLDSELSLEAGGAQSFVASDLASVTIGSGPDIIALSMAEDYALSAHAQFTVSVDGVQVGGVETAFASKAAGNAQTFDIQGTFSSDTLHTVAIDFLNDAYAPGPGNDRNLFLEGATLDGQALPNSTLNLYSGGTQSFLADAGVDTQVNGVNQIGSGSDTLVLELSEDAYQGDAKFVVTVNGQQVGGIQTATAPHGSGMETNLDVLGAFSQPSTIGIDFINDAYNPATGQDRNLYVDTATINGETIAGSKLSLMSSGTQTFQADALSSPVVIGAGSSTLALSLSEDYALGSHAQFTIGIDGTQVGGVQTAYASQALKEVQTFDIMANLSPTTSHLVTVNFLNDAWASGPGNDRNLYVNGATLNGSAVSNSTLLLYSGGPQSIFIPAHPTS